jgi:hypothetical protein
MQRIVGARAQVLHAVMRTEGTAQDAITTSGLKCLTKLFGCFAQRDNSHV